MREVTETECPQRKEEEEQEVKRCSASAVRFWMCPHFLSICYIHYSKFIHLFVSAYEAAGTFHCITHCSGRTLYLWVDGMRTVTPEGNFTWRSEVWKHFYIIQMKESWHCNLLVSLNGLDISLFEGRIETGGAHLATVRATNNLVLCPTEECSHLCCVINCFKTRTETQLERTACHYPGYSRRHESTVF
jgi:hypothetical protein